VIRLHTPQHHGIRPVENVGTIDDRLVTELLRLDGPAQAVVRTATHDHTFSEVTIHAGEPALVVLAAANRDPVIFNSPD
jgi:cytochrome P450